jgi:hypothetical protein
MPALPSHIVDLVLDLPIPAEVNGRRNGVANDPIWDAAYRPCKDAYPGDEVPVSVVRKLDAWDGSRVYPGTRRHLWLHTPAGRAAAVLQRRRLVPVAVGPRARERGAGHAAPPRGDPADGCWILRATWSTRRSSQ